MTTGRTRLGIALLVAAGVLLATAVIGAVLLASEGTPGAGTPGPLVRALRDAGAASAPFPGLTEAEVRVGGLPMRVVVADSSDERGEGLRRRSDLGSYDGMLFVFDEDTSTAFTMSTVPVALDIGFYDAAGRRVSRLRMQPCATVESACPSYRSVAPFRYALETLAGGLPAGRLR